MDHGKHVYLSNTELTPSPLKGATVYGADDHKVGKVDHVHGIGGEAIIDVGGFLSIGANVTEVPNWCAKPTDHPRYNERALPTTRTRAG